jgi:CHAD domain-containing protein
MGELAFAVIRRQVAVLRDKEPGTRLGEDPEELHDMRVATRRLRAALDLFESVLPARARALRHELGWLAGLLGVVRDLDVQREGLADMTAATVGWAAELGWVGQDPLADLAELLERDWVAARDDMLRGLDSVRWERLANGLAAMVRQGPLRRSVASRAPAVVGMPELVEARHAAVAKAGKRARRSGVVADFHRLRIRCKRLRYSLEFSAEVYGGRTSRYVRQLTALQDQLGLMQDAEVASVRLAELATGEAHLPASTVFVMGAVAERHRRDVTRLLRRLHKEVTRVGGREWDDLVELMQRRRAEAEALNPPVRRTLRAVPPPPPAPATPGNATQPAPAPERPPTLTAFERPSPAGHPSGQGEVGSEG